MNLEEYENIYNVLMERVYKECEEYEARLLAMSAKEVMLLSYETVIRADIVSILEYDYVPSEEDTEVTLGKKNDMYAKLLRFDNPIAVCYSAWLKSDASHMQDLKDAIENYIQYY